MHVFENRPRDDHRRRDPGERSLNFYDRSSRRCAVVLRDLVNSWVEDCPPEAAADLVARMRSGEDRDFDTALTEILMHATFLRLGFQPQWHPSLPATSKHPDFLLRRDDQDIAYVEVTTINPLDADVGRDNRESVIRNAIDAAALPEDIWIEYEMMEFGNTSPPGKRLKEGISRWAAQYADVVRSGKEVVRQFSIDGWCFRLSLSVGYGVRPTNGRSIAKFGLVDGQFAGPAKPLDGLAKRLEDKAGKYGTFAIPYLIVVFDRTECLSWYYPDFPMNVLDVLFGEQQPRVASRDSRGLFGYPDKPKKTHVSAVLVFPHVDLERLAVRHSGHEPLLVRNPWADRPIREGMLPLRELVMRQECGQVVPGRMIADIVGIPNGQAER